MDEGIISPNFLKLLRKNFLADANISALEKNTFNGVRCAFNGVNNTLLAV